MRSVTEAAHVGFGGGFDGARPAGREIVFGGEDGVGARGKAPGSNNQRPEKLRAEITNDEWRMRNQMSNVKASSQ